MPELIGIFSMYGSSELTHIIFEYLYSNEWDDSRYHFTPDKELNILTDKFLERLPGIAYRSYKL